MLTLKIDIPRNLKHFGPCHHLYSLSLDHRSPSSVSKATTITTANFFPWYYKVQRHSNDPNLLYIATHLNKDRTEMKMIKNVLNFV